MELSDARLAELEADAENGEYIDWNDVGYLLDEVRSSRAALVKLRTVADSHPTPCTEHGISDVVSCGWKHAYAEMVAAVRST